MFFRILPYIIASLLMGAHSLRAREPVFIVISLLLPLLLLIRKRLVLIFLQVLAYIGALEWLRATFNYVQIRINLGMPWARLAAILGVVALFTAFAGYLLNSKKVKEKYH